MRLDAIVLQYLYLTISGFWIRRLRIRISTVVYLFMKSQFANYLIIYGLPKTRIDDIQKEKHVTWGTSFFNFEIQIGAFQDFKTQWTIYLIPHLKVGSQNQIEGKIQIIQWKLPYLIGLTKHWSRSKKDNRRSNNEEQRYRSRYTGELSDRLGPSWSTAQPDEIVTDEKHRSEHNRSFAKVCNFIYPPTLRGLTK